VKNSSIAAFGWAPDIDLKTRSLRLGVFWQILRAAVRVIATEHGPKSKNKMTKYLTYV
jgi:hypothetical protein